LHIMIPCRRSIQASEPPPMENTLVGACRCNPNPPPYHCRSVATLVTLVLHDTLSW
jgi:hypothetical protein